MVVQQFVFVVFVVDELVEYLHQFEFGFVKHFDEFRFFFERVVAFEFFG